MSIVLIAFEGAPTVSDDAIQKERELDEQIEVKIKGWCCVLVIIIVISHLQCMLCM